MPENDVSVRFGAETAPVKAGGDEVKGVLAGIGTGVKGLIGAFLELGGAATGSFREIRAGAAEAAAGIKETAAGVKEFRESIVEFGELLIAAFAVEQIAEFAKKMGETAESVQHTAQTFGLATSEVQQLRAEAALLGIPFEAMTTAMQRSDRALTTARQGSKQTAEAFKTIGINIHEPIGQVELIHKELEGLAGIEDIPTRIGLAMQLFGRNIQAIGPMIGVTKEQLDEYDQKIADYGVKSDDAQAKGLALAESFNTNTVAMQGLGNVMTSALAPVLTQIVDGLDGMIKGFIQSYNSGGIAKQALDFVVVSLKVLVSALALLGGGLVGAFDLGVALIDSFSASWKTAADLFLNNGKQMIDEVITVGKVMYDSLTNNVLQAAQDMKAGWATMEADAKKTANDFAADFQAAAKAASGAVNEAMSVGRGTAGFLGGLWGPPTPTPTPPKTASGGGAPPNLGTGSGHGESQVGKWTEQLHEQELKAAADTGDYMKDQTAMEIAFWQQKLTLVSTGSKAWYEVQDKLFTLLKQQATETFNALVAGDKEAIERDKDNHAAWAADWQKYLADVAKAYGQDSAQFKNALREKEAAERQFVESMRQLEAKRLQDAEKAQQSSLQGELAIAKISTSEQAALIDEQERSGVISGQAAFAQRRALLAQEQAAESAAAQQEYIDQFNSLAKIQALYPRDSAKWAEIQAQKNQITAQYGVQQQVMAAQQSQQWFNSWLQRLQQLKAQFHSYVDPVVQAWGSAMTQMIQGTMSFRQAVASIGESILQVFVGIAERLVENWIVNLLVGQVAQKTSAETQVASYAGIAGAAGVASMAGAPFPLDLGAPEFGAAMSAAALGFGALASAAGGWDRVPQDQLAMVHKDEMVMSAPLAGLFRGLAGMGSSLPKLALPKFDMPALSVASAPSAGAAQSGPWGGGLHIEGPQISVSGGNGSPADIASAVVRALKDHPTRVADAVGTALRSGWRPSYKQPTGVL